MSCLACLFSLFCPLSFPKMFRKTPQSFFFLSFFLQLVLTFVKTCDFMSVLFCWFVLLVLYVNHQLCRVICYRLMMNHISLSDRLSHLFSSPSLFVCICVYFSKNMIKFMYAHEVMRTNNSSNNRSKHSDNIIFADIQEY